MTDEGGGGKVGSGSCAAGSPCPGNGPSRLDRTHDLQADALTGRTGWSTVASDKLGRELYVVGVEGAVWCDHQAGDVRPLEGVLVRGVLPSSIPISL